MLNQKAKTLARGQNYAAVTTLAPTGQPMTHLMWVDADEDCVYVNTEVERAKFQNIQTDPRVSVLVVETGNPFSFAEIRGRVIDATTGAEARQHLDDLSQRYTGGPYSMPIASERVKIKIEPERVRSR